MSIERDKGIVFHEEGTLNAVTRWISSHDEKWNFEGMRS